LIGVLISCLQKQQIARSFIEKGIRAVTNACDTSLMGVDVFHFVTIFLICFLHPNSPLPSIVVKQSTVKQSTVAMKFIEAFENDSMIILKNRQKYQSITSTKTVTAGSIH